MSFAGLPDWDAPVWLGDRAVFAAFEQPTRYFVAPVRLDAVGVGDTPPFQLDLYQQDRVDAGLAEFGLLTVRFAAQFELEAAREAAFMSMPQARIEPLRAESGFLRLTAAAALGLPGAVTTPQSLDVASVGSATLGVRLDGTAAEIFLGALREGLATIGAEAWLAVRGVSVRMPGTVELDPAAVFEALGPAGQPSRMVAVSALHQRLADDPGSLAVRHGGAVATDQRLRYAEAVVDRLVGRFGTLVAAPDGAQGAWVRLDRAAMAPGVLRWSLDEPMLVPRLFALQADPLGPLRWLSHDEFEGRVVRRHAVAALRSGWWRVSVDTTLSAQAAGVLATAVDITVPARPPQRPATVKRTVLLDAATRPATVELRLAPGEPLAYEWQVVNHVQVDGAVETIDGPPRHADRAHLTLTPDDYGIGFVPVDADASLLAQAAVEVECMGTRGGRPWLVRGALDAGHPSVALAVPADVADAQIGACAVALADGCRRRMPAMPARALRLDPFSFEGSGARAVEVQGVFEDSADEVLVELAPEDLTGEPARRERLRLTRASPTARWSWLALSPFRSGFRWRMVGEDDWSPVLQPDAPLVVPGGRRNAGDAVATESFEIDGVRLTPLAGQPATWAYRPSAAGIAPGPDGRPQFTLIEAGPVAMLALTAMWGVAADRLEALRAKLAERAKLPVRQVALSPAAVDVHEVSLLLGDEAGAFTPLATTTSSGAPPHHAAFNVTLDAGQLERVKKAVAGKRGWLAVRYVVRDQAAGARTASSTISSSTSATTTVTRSSGGASVTTRDASSVEHAASSGTSSAAPAAPVEVFQADAADWGLHGR